MTRSLLIAGLLLTAAPAYAQERLPDAGTLGIGAFIGGTASNVGNIITIAPGLNATFWATDRLTIQGVLGLSTVENGVTNFTIIGGAAYYLLKDPTGIGAFVGGNFGVNVASQNNNSNTSIILQLGGGGEYFVSEHFGVFVSEGLQFSTEPTTFALVTQFGPRVYF